MDFSKLSEIVIVKTIIEENLIGSHQVSKFFIIEEIKNRVDPIRLFNKTLTFEGGVTNDGVKNLHIGACKFFRDAFRHLKKHYQIDDDGWITRRTVDFKKTCRTKNYYLELYFILPNEWIHKNDLYGLFSKAVADEDAIGEYEKRKRYQSYCETDDPEERLEIGRKSLFSHALSRLKEQNRLERVGSVIRRGPGRPGQRLSPSREQQVKPKQEERKVKRMREKDYYTLGMSFLETPMKRADFIIKLEKEITEEDAHKFYIGRRDSGKVPIKKSRSEEISTGRRRMAIDDILSKLKTTRRIEEEDGLLKAVL